ncbi:putative calcium-binding protein CML41 [Forsythia ovata]|uniref:Calcium-binding protein CML41 n=1 Tax=Forsythia ovata TaxID=205694 RepID=A0ABD1P5I7_9LAMI
MAARIAKSLKLHFRSKPKTPSPPSTPPSPTTANGGGAHSLAMQKPNNSAKEDEFRQVFSYFDNDKDGRISADELRSYFTSIGESMTQDEAQKIVLEFDKNGDSLLEYEEFVVLMEKDDNVLRKAFEVFEVEKGSGFITAEGLRQVLRRLGNSKSYQECEDMIRVFDLDGNGVLDFYEFNKMMTN